MIVHSIVVRPHEKAGYFQVVITSENPGRGLGQTHIELVAAESDLRVWRNEIDKAIGEKPKFDLFGEKE